MEGIRFCSVITRRCDRYFYDMPSITSYIRWDFGSIFFNFPTKKGGFRIDIRDVIFFFGGG